MMVEDFGHLSGKAFTKIPSGFVWCFVLRER